MRTGGVALPATFLSLFPALCWTANVLVFMPLPLKSHVGGFQPLFEELARRGHNVTVVSAYPLAAAGRRVANYTDVPVPPLKIEGKQVYRRHDTAL